MPRESLPPAGPENQADQKAANLRRGFLERLYKSKIARALALAGALSGSAVIYKNLYREGQIPRSEYAYNLGETDEIKLGPLGEKYRSIKNIEGRNPLVIHIGQMHGADSILETKRDLERRNMGLDDLINHQKNLEELILYLRDSYHVKQFYVEGLHSDLQKLLVMVSNDTISAIIEAKDNPEYIEKVYDAFMQVAEKQRLERYGALVLYAVAQGAQRALEMGLPQKTHSATQNLIERIKNHPSLTGDNVYIWGAPMKLWLEGKIVARPVEILEESQNARDLRRNDRSPAAFERSLNIQEDAALKIIQKEIGDREVLVPVIYGNGHDFSDNVHKQNQGRGSVKMGLITLVPKI